MFRIINRLFLTGGILSCFVFISQLSAVNYSKVITFGDSLMDAGNVYSMVKGINEPNRGRPGYKYELDLTYNRYDYWEGRASDGPLWTEHLGYSYNPLTDNYAIANSETGSSLGGLFSPSENVRDNLMGTFMPGLGMQIDTIIHGDIVKVRKDLRKIIEQHKQNSYFPYWEYFNKLSTKRPHNLDPNALYTIWSGANDIAHIAIDQKFSVDYDKKQHKVEKAIETAVGNISEGVQKLYSRGARHVLVMNLPAILPDRYKFKYQDGDDPVKAMKYFNIELKKSLTTLAAQNPKLNIIPIDVQKITEELNEDPELRNKFGFTDIRDCNYYTVFKYEQKVDLVEVDENGAPKLNRANRENVDTQANLDSYTINNQGYYVKRGKLFKVKSGPYNVRRFKEFVHNDKKGLLFYDEYGHLTKEAQKFLGEYIRVFLEAPQRFAQQMKVMNAAAKIQATNVGNRMMAMRGQFAAPMLSPQQSITNNFHQDEDKVEHIFMSSDQKGNIHPQGKISNQRHFHGRYSKHATNDQFNYLPSMQNENGAGKLGLFIAGDLSKGTHKPQDDAPGFRHTAKSITVGGDYKVSDDLLAGIAVSYVRSDTRLKGDIGDIDIDGYAASLYGSWKYTPFDLGFFYVDGVATYGWNQFMLKGKILSFGRTSKASPLGSHWLLGGKVGYDVEWNKFIVGPTCGLRYTESKIDSFTERGAGAFNHWVQKQKSTSLVLTTGAHLAYVFDCAIGKIRPEIKGSFDHEAKDKGREIVTEIATMRGIPFNTPVNTKTTNYGRFGGGVSVFLKNDISLEVNYEYAFAHKRSRDHYGFAKARILM
jgi:phospholipase/lecithinase/hemolysin